ncbi:hypothetical protein NITMOv2_3105 [Nitrospira moscoviensis]|uniref:Uncharacterized protein n=1 Tax=Nitrospira moscoviensis TaxID=42253 RepID=A0A0K2GF82_NITMO|nr:hypothetical protein NITMOv2_3105 [Nitrospira moscoviensis]
MAQLSLTTVRTDAYASGSPWPPAHVQRVFAVPDRHITTHTQGPSVTSTLDWSLLTTERTGLSVTRVTRPADGASGSLHHNGTEALTYCAGSQLRGMAFPTLVTNWLPIQMPYDPTGIAAGATDFLLGRTTPDTHPTLMKDALQESFFVADRTDPNRRHGFRLLLRSMDTCLNEGQST